LQSCLFQEVPIDEVVEESKVLDELEEWIESVVLNVLTLLQKKNDACLNKKGAEKRLVEETKITQKDQATQSMPIIEEELYFQQFNFDREKNVSSTICPSGNGSSVCITEHGCEQYAFSVAPTQPPEALEKQDCSVGNLKCKENVSLDEFAQLKQQIVEDIIEQASHILDAQFQNRLHEFEHEMSDKLKELSIAQCTELTRFKVDAEALYRFHRSVEKDWNDKLSYAQQKWKKELSFVKEKMDYLSSCAEMEKGQVQLFHTDLKSFADQTIACQVKLDSFGTKLVAIEMQNSDFRNLLTVLEENVQLLNKMQCECKATKPMKTRTANKVADCHLKENSCQQKTPQNLEKDSSFNERTIPKSKSLVDFHCGDSTMSLDTGISKRNKKIPQRCTTSERKKPSESFLKIKNTRIPQVVSIPYSVDVCQNSFLKEIDNIDLMAETTKKEWMEDNILFDFQENPLQRFFDLQTPAINEVSSNRISEVKNVSTIQFDKRDKFSLQRLKESAHYQDKDATIEVDTLEGIPMISKRFIVAANIQTVNEDGNKEVIATGVINIGKFDQTASDDDNLSHEKKQSNADKGSKKSPLSSTAPQLVMVDIHRSCLERNDERGLDLSTTADSYKNHQSYSNDDILGECIVDERRSKIMEVVHVSLGGKSDNEEQSYTFSFDTISQHSGRDELLTIC